MQPFAPPLPDDRTLLRTYAVDRSEQAFASFVARHADFIRAVAARHLGHDRRLAEDVTQAVFVIAARKASTAVSARSIRGWLFTVTILTANNARRGERRRVRREQRIAPPTPTTTPPADVLTAEQTALVQQALADLRPKDRDAVVLHHMDGQPIAAVADAFGIGVEAAKKRVQRATARLRRAADMRGVTAPAIATVATLAKGIPAEATTLQITGGHGVALARQTLWSMKVAAVGKAAVLVTAVMLPAAASVVVLAQDNTPLPATPIAQIAPPPSVETSLSIVAITRNNDEHDTWWGPDGTPLDGPPPGFVSNPSSREVDGGYVAVHSDWTVVVALDGPFDWANKVDLDVPPEHAALGASNSLNPNEAGVVADDYSRESNLLAFSISGFKDADRMDVHVRLASGPVQMLSAADRTGKVIETILPLTPPERWMQNPKGREHWITPGWVMWLPASRGDNGNAYGTVITALRGYDTDLYAVNADGESFRNTGLRIDERRIAGGVGMARDGVRTWYGQFDDLPLEELDRLELRGRPWQEYTFHDIALQPNSGITQPWIDDAAIDAIGPADETIPGTVNLTGLTVADAMEQIARRSGIEINWRDMSDIATASISDRERYGAINGDETLPDLVLGGVTPAVAVESAWRAAGGRNVTVTIERGGRAVWIVPETQHTLDGNRRLRAAWQMPLPQ